MRFKQRRFRVECRFGDVGVAYVEAYVEAITQEEAEKKANELDGGEFLVDDKANMGDAEIISVAEEEMASIIDRDALADDEQEMCCPEGTGECSNEAGHVTPSEGHCLECCTVDCTDCSCPDCGTSGTDYNTGLCCGAAIAKRMAEKEAQS